MNYVGANLTVTAASLTVTADAQSRVYGGGNPALSYVSSGLVNGDTLTGLLATTATASSDVGAYAITQGSLAASSNYALSYVGANLTVTAASLTVTADAQSRVYGAGNPALSYVSSGLINGDTLSRAARHHRDRQLQRRRLRHHPGQPRGVVELRAELCRRQPHRHRGVAHGHRAAAYRDRTAAYRGGKCAAGGVPQLLQSE